MYLVRYLIYAGEAGVNLGQIPLIASDTKVALNGQIFGKSTDEGDAAKILRCLSGNTHQVMSAVAVFYQG